MTDYQTIRNSPRAKLGSYSVERCKGGIAACEALMSCEPMSNFYQRYADLKQFWRAQLEIAERREKQTPGV